MAAGHTSKEIAKMTKNYPPAATPPPRGEPLPPPGPEPDTAPRPQTAEPAGLEGTGQEQGMADMAKGHAADLSHSGLEAGKHAAETARDQAAGVAAEASRQGRNLLRQAQDQAGHQVSQGHERLATGLLSVSDELRSMADSSGQDSLAAGFARQAASWARDAGQWLGDRRPAQVLDEAQSFARRRPGTFVALAAGAGLVAGRLTRGMTAASSGATAPDGGPELVGPQERFPDTAGHSRQAPAVSGDFPAAAEPVTADVPAWRTEATFTSSAVSAGDQAGPRDLR
jgi:ElaB/YqjD/DUF883 family membrane-anchored ribosome-binding protein